MLAGFLSAHGPGEGVGCCGGGGWGGMGFYGLGDEDPLDSSMTPEQEAAFHAAHRKKPKKAGMPWWILPVAVVGAGWWLLRSKARGG